MDEWPAFARHIITRNLARPGMAALVAYHPEAVAGDSDLYGWLAYTRDYQVMKRGRLSSADVPLIAYVYVKATFRGMGIARDLLAAAGIDGRFNYARNTPVVTQLDRAGKIPPGSEWLHLTLRFPHQPKEEPHHEHPRQARPAGQTHPHQEHEPAQR